MIKLNVGYLGLQGSEFESLFIYELFKNNSCIRLLFLVFIQDVVFVIFEVLEKIFIIYSVF